MELPRDLRARGHATTMDGADVMPSGKIVIDKKILIALLAIAGTGALVAFMDAFNICPLCGGDGVVGEVELMQSGDGMHPGETLEYGKYISRSKPETCPWLLSAPWLHVSTA